ncbi:OmpA family protein [Cochlodiniinecator piscidefendens]|uniref:OmpA family protein n=1 Tax=Cochlodiniinecator piscidefendens TaxID=2715756 RepID=UPI001E3DC12E|nr:OmpA family protein [Cochlodiniinecator piscidefendens]
MTKRMTYALALTASIAVAGCSDDPFAFFTGESGGAINSADFGNATMNNVLIQSGQRSYAISLAQRFAGEVTPTVNFEFNSAQLDDGARQVLMQQAEWIRQFPEITFRVFGHTDLVGSDSYNRRLGLRRARAVVAFLATQGIDRSRLEAVSSLGESEPLINTQGPERRNRRTETQVSGFVQSNQTIMDGNYARVIYREYVESATVAHPIERGGSQGSGDGEGSSE